MKSEAADPKAIEPPSVSMDEGLQHTHRRAWRWPALGLGVWMLVGLLGLTVLLSMVGSSSSSMAMFVLGPLILGGASIWIGGLLVLLIWLLVAAISAEPPARAVAVIAAVALVLVTTGGLAGLSRMGSTAAPSSSGSVLSEGRVPPVGAIWFGRVYDPDTHALSWCPGEVIVGCETAVSDDRLVVLVAHFPRAVREAVEIRWGGTTTLHTNTVPADGEFLVDWGFGPFTEPGYNTVVVTDLDGNYLASGGLTVWGP